MPRQSLEVVSVEQALNLAQSLITTEQLTTVQYTVLRLAYLGNTYEEIAEASGYSVQHIRDVGYKLWQLLSKNLGEKVTKNNFQSVLSQRFQHSITQQSQINTSKFPEGSLRLDDNNFYMERPPIEERCYREILKPGALLRIRAPKRMGKTSLMMRILAQAANHNHHTIRLNFSHTDEAILNNLDRFLRWFCANISRQLKFESRLDDYWDEDLGSKVSCTTYLQGYILEQLDHPLVLALDEVDRLFEFPDTAQDFLPLLRFWHEEANNLELWSKLRLIVVHSTEVYIPLNIHQSPFNVGLAIKLPEFNHQQVQELAKLYGLDWLGNEQIEQLMAMVGGHPYLIKQAFYQLKSENITFEQLLQDAPTHAGIYSNHLRGHLSKLNSTPELAHALKQLVIANSSLQLPSIQAYKLDSMGLVKLIGNEVTPSCQLYRLYFHQQLG